MSNNDGKPKESPRPNKSDEEEPPAKGSVFIGWGKKAASAEPSSKSNANNSRDAEPAAPSATDGGAPMGNSSVFAGQKSPFANQSVFLGFKSKPAAVGNQTDAPIDPDSNSAALRNSVFLGLRKQHSTPVPKESVSVPTSTSYSGKMQKAQLVETESGGDVGTTKREQNRLSSLVIAKIKELQLQIFDVSNMGANEGIYKSIVDVYIFVAACLMVSWLGSVFGAYVLQKIVPNLVSFVIVVFILPLTTLCFFRPDERDDEEPRRLNLMVLIVLYAVSVGTWSTDRFNGFNSPPAILFPLSVACSAWRFGTRFGEMSRDSMLMITVVPCLAIYVLLATVSQSMSAACFVWLSAMTLTTLIDLQMKFARLREGKFSIFYEQIYSVISFAAVDLIIMHVLSD